ncbi:unnamed protein product [Ectocarpus sp. CCAP 1310/34]|nr:unnamed protein product [Ectocarpus sp. CCAP 1310/34]
MSRAFCHQLRYILATLSNER